MQPRNTEKHSLFILQRKPKGIRFVLYCKFQISNKNWQDINVVGKMSPNELRETEDTFVEASVENLYAQQALVDKQQTIILYCVI